MLEHLGSILPVLVQYWQLSLLTGGLTRQLRSPPLSPLAFSLLIKHCSWQRALMSWERCQVRLSLRRSAQGSSIQRSSILIRWPRPWSGSLSGACLPITRGGILTRESYALVAGLAGAGLATAGPSVILWGRTVEGPDRALLFHLPRVPWGPGNHGFALSRFLV